MGCSVGNAKATNLGADILILKQTIYAIIRGKKTIHINMHGSRKCSNSYHRIEKLRKKGSEGNGIPT